ncbi:MAG: pantetheine-phosphate adenylyltransferase [Candidatus Altiarchaeota archaeon]|nr:pantetheine-phosphate adenylyltransferase [Candidatus Altiarchaeota archaeon]
MFKKTVVGGTFNGLHNGHKKVLKTAFENSKHITIGLTSDDFARRFKTKKITSYAKRKRELEKFIKTLKTPYEVVEINDIYGIATIDPGLDSIVVSDETLLRAEEINTIRFKKTLPRLTIIVVPLVLDSKGRPLSSSR